MSDLIWQLAKKSIFDSASIEKSTFLLVFHLAHFNSAKRLQLRRTLCTIFDKLQGSESPNLIPSAIRQISVVEEPVPMKISANSELFVQETAITLPARDDTAEYDDPSDTLTFKDDPK